MCSFGCTLSVDMAALFLVFGTSGSGKTTVLAKVKKAKPIGIGTALHEAYEKKFKGLDRDALRFKELETYGFMSAIRSRVLRNLTKGAGRVMLDTHACVKAGDGYIPGLSLHDCTLLRGSAKAIIYIDAKTEDIIARRRSDKSRRRGNESAEELDMLRSIGMSLSMAYALHLQVPVYVVQNDDAGKAAKKVDGIIERSC